MWITFLFLLMTQDQTKTFTGGIMDIPNAWYPPTSGRTDLRFNNTLFNSTESKKQCIVIIWDGVMPSGCTTCMCMTTTNLKAHIRFYTTLSWLVSCTVKLLTPSLKYLFQISTGSTAATCRPMRESRLETCSYYTSESFKHLCHRLSWS